MNRLMQICGLLVSEILMLSRFFNKSKIFTCTIHSGPTASSVEEYTSLIGSESTFQNDRRRLVIAYTRRRCAPSVLYVLLYSLMNLCFENNKKIS